MELVKSSTVTKFAKEILKVIGDYSKALDLLDDYDHKTLKNE